jgi:hypothetical protein
MGEMTNTNKIIIEYPEGKRPLGRHICIWKDTIKSNLINTYGGRILTEFMCFIIRTRCRLL